MAIIKRVRAVSDIKDNSEKFYPCSRSPFFVFYCFVLFYLRLLAASLFRLMLCSVEPYLVRLVYLSIR